MEKNNNNNLSLQIKEAEMEEVFLLKNILLSENSLPRNNLSLERYF